MPEPLKNMFNRNSLNELASSIKTIYEPFQTDGFLNSTMDGTWDGLELKARVRQISKNLGKYLPEDYENAIGILEKVTDIFYGPELFCFPDFVEVHGQDVTHWDVSIKALEKFTQHSSSEFAVRPFIIDHEERMMAQMYDWSKHENEHVRRLASEGCRPSLPWGQALARYKKDPTPILPILEQLKDDPSLYVRKSVANNLNDISKTHPDIVIRIAKEWYGKNERTDWIVKHACRTLLKKGDREVLAIFGHEDIDSVEVGDLSLNAISVKIGGDVTFSFSIEAKKETKVRLEYGIDYVKSNGKRNRKIFQLSEIVLKNGERRSYTKKHSFADLTTRKHYPGTHSITLMVNGTEKGTIDLELFLSR